MAAMLTSMLPMLLPMVLNSGGQHQPIQQAASHQHVINVAGPTVNVGTVAHHGQTVPMIAAPPSVYQGFYQDHQHRTLQDAQMDALRARLQVGIENMSRGLIDDNGPPLKRIRRKLFC